MLNQIIAVLPAWMLIFTVTLLSVSGDLAFNKSECPLTDIDSRLSVALDIIETARRKLPNDFREICRKITFEDKPINCSDCSKCPYEEKPIDCRKCPCEKELTNCSECINSTREAKPVDCSDIYRDGYHGNGPYWIWPQSRISKGPLAVFCDMSDGGGWTVIQRRGDFGNPEDYFYNDWNTYKIGFGDILKEYWIGNDKIYALTNQNAYQLRVNLRDWEEEFAYATYDEFWIEDELHNYTLHVNGYNGDAGDSLAYSNGSQFTTKDRENDIYSGGNCAVEYKGAWWYKTCSYSNLNGLYLKGLQQREGGIFWNQFKGQKYSLKDAIMKIRPTSFIVNIKK